MRLVRWVFWPLVAAFALLSPALAQNGLQRFERDIKPQLEFEKFTYRSATALGANGFVLNDVVAVLPPSRETGDKASTIKVDKVIVEEFDFDRVPPKRLPGSKESKADDDMPRFAKIRFEGLSGDDDMQGLLARYGIPRVPVDAVLDYRLDVPTKVLTVNKIELELRGLARLELNLVLDGISDKKSTLEGAKDDGRLRSAALVIDDKGLLVQLLPAVARANGGTAEIWVGLAQASLQGFAENQGPETLKALDAIVSFLGDWRQPKGPIRISIRPPRTTGLDDLPKLLEPNGLTDVLALTATYEGTRPGAATSGGGGGMTQPPQRTPRTQRPPREEQGEVRRLTGKAAWDTVVGNTLTGRAGGKTYHDLYRADGTLASLQDGEITPGKWAMDGDKVCTSRGSQARTCYEVVASGRTITLTDSSGRGLRATLLRGNPRDL